MIVSIKNVGYGQYWSKYVLKNREGATCITGNPTLGDRICQSLDYKSGNSINFVISFDAQMEKTKGRAIAKDFMKTYLQGFREDEYHLDIVEHDDTDHLHYHCRIPKINLLTQTQLKLYYHKTDLSFKKAVIDDVCLRNGIIPGSEKKRLINSSDQVQRIEKWREQHSQKPFVFKGKKNRTEAEQSINSYLQEMINSGLINSLDDVKNELTLLGLDVVNSGFDKGKEFHYLTVSNESGKLRLKGDIYGERFYRHSQADRETAIKNNRSLENGREEFGRSEQDIKQTLSRELNRRFKWIDQQYGNSRKRAVEEKRRAIERSLEERVKRDTKRAKSFEKKHTQIKSGDVAKSKRFAISNEQAKLYNANIDNRDVGSRGRVGVVDKTEAEFSRASGKWRDSKNERRTALDTQGFSISGSEFEDNRKEALDDRIRRKIIEAVGDTTRGIYSRVEADKQVLYSEYERSEKSDRDTKERVGGAKKIIANFVYQHRDKAVSTFAREVGGVKEVRQYPDFIFEREIEGDIGRFSNAFAKFRSHINGLHEKVREVGRTVEIHLEKIKKRVTQILDDRAYYREQELLRELEEREREYSNGYDRSPSPSPFGR